MINPNTKYPRLSAGGQTDKNTEEIQSLNRAIGPKVDSRNTVEHTFASTAPVTIRHGLGRTPQGGHAIMVSQASNIHVLSATKTDITVQSTVAGTTATLLLI